MKPVSEITAMVVDNGLFVELASRLGRTYKKVYYTVPWISAFPKMNNAKIGEGLENFEVVDSMYGPHFDDIDLFVFPDVYFGPLQMHLLSLGKTVWGSRMGEELELYRADTKEYMRSVGLPVGNYKVITGTAALREHLKKNKRQYVKVDKYRGHFETFLSKDYQSVEPKLDEIECQLGAFKYITEFVVEEELADRVELGIDGYCVDGEFPTQLLSGIEVKDEAYVGIFKKYADIPKPVTEWERKMKPALKAYGYRGFISTEVRVGKDGLGYMIDCCARAGSPPSEVYQEFYLNLPEIIWNGANGILIDPKPAGKYAAEALIHSSWADKNWRPIDFPAKFRNNIKLRNAAKINGRYYVIPQSMGLPEIGAIVGFGNTLKEATDQVTEIAESVTGYYIDIHTSAFEKAQEEIDKSAKYGIKGNF